MDFESFVASIVQEKFMQFDEEALDAREQQGIAQKGLGTRPMSDRPGMTKEVVDEKEDKPVSTATRVLSGMADYYEPDEFPTQDVRIDRAPKFGSLNRSTVLDILSANRDGLERQGIVKMPMGMLRKPDPTLDIDGLQSRILDKLDYKTPEGSVQDIQYGLDAGQLGKVEGVGDESINVDRDTIDPDTVGAIPRPELGGLMAPRGDRDSVVLAQEYLGITVDGDFGPGTSRALAAFQYKNNIPVSGQVDDETIKAMQNPDTLDPREATIKVNDVLNAEGTRPDIEKLKAWSKKNIKDPMRAAAFVATVEAESGTGLVEAGHTLASAIRTFVTNNPDMHVDRDKNKPLTAKGERRKQKLEALGSDASGDDIFDFIYGTDTDAIGSKLGNTQAGDGSTFKGRGLIQLSGRENYQKVGDILGLDLVSSPELVNDSKHAVAIAMAYLTLPNKNFFLNKMNPVNGVAAPIDGLTSEKLAQVVGHSGGASAARNRFRRATELREEMYN